MPRTPLRAALVALAALLPALALGLALVSTAPPAAAAATPVRVMPLGDSITGSPGCWRALLWNRLQTTGYPDVDFVGTLGPQGCSVPYDGDNEGHGGYLVTNVANQNLLPGWLNATRPDVVLMHFGTNDVWSNIAPTTILAAYSRLVDQMRASNPAMAVLVAKIIPMNPPTCAECGQRVVALNAAIDGWAAGKTTAASPVVVVDQWTGFNTATDTYDGVHPNAAGDQKMSDRWYPALTAALGRSTPTPTVSPTGGPTPTPTVSPTGGPTPTPTVSPTGGPTPTPTVSPTGGPTPTPTVSPTGGPTPTPTVSPTGGPTPSPTTSPSGGPTPTPAGGCAATYRTAGQWPGGFQGEVTVANPGSAPIGGWTVRFTLPAGQRIIQAWGAELTQTGTTVTARNAGWNGTLAPAAQTSWGFLADGSPIMVPLTCTAG